VVSIVAIELFQDDIIENQTTVVRACGQ